MKAAAFRRYCEILGFRNQLHAEDFEATDRSVSWSALVEVALRELVKPSDRIAILTEYDVRARRPNREVR